MSTNPTDYGGIPTQELGDNLNAWGVDPTAGLNNALNLLTYGIHSVLTLSLTGDTTLTSTSYAVNQSRRFGLILTDGGLAATAVVTVPSVEGRYAVYNSTSFNIGFKTSGGSTVTIPAGLADLILCDGTDCYLMIDRRLDQISAPTNAVDLNSQKLTSVATGTDGTDGVNLSQMNTAIASAGVPATSGAVLVSANDTTSRFLIDALVAGSNITITENNDGADETVTLAADTSTLISGATAATTVATTDSVLIYDTSATANKKATISDLISETIQQGEHTIYMPVAAMSARTTNGASAAIEELTSNDVMLSTLDFDAATEEAVQFSVGMPESWDEGTFTAEFAWTAGSGSGAVVWGLSAVAVGNDDALDAAMGTEQTVTDTLITANDLHWSGATSAVTAAGTPAAGDMVIFQVARVAANGSDTLGVDAKLLGVRLKLTINAATD